MTSSWRIIEGDCTAALTELAPASVDAIVTDPPYGLEFMGKDWDRPWAVSAEQRVGFEGREDNLTLPAHRDGRNANCRACGGRARGANRCQCAKPRWDRAPAQDMRDFQAWCEAWAMEALRVLKPGGHLLAFGGTRTYHRLAAGIEDAGFEVRDCLAWMYGSGFPKSLDVSKAIDKAAGAEREVVGPRRWAGRDPNGTALGQMNDDDWKAKPDAENGATAPATPDAARWEGWGTALKPAFEPVVLARKPLAGTVAGNVLAHGVGALNVERCRIEAQGRPAREVAALREDVEYHPTSLAGRVDGSLQSSKAVGTTDEGRWPANVLLDAAAAALLDAQTGELVSGSRAEGVRTGLGYHGAAGDGGPAIEGDRGGASRFFYCSKASSAERNAGLDGFEPTGRTLGHKRCAACGRQKVNVPGSECQCPEPREWVAVEAHSPRANSHPTVKPIDVMRWLCRLVTPPGGTVLDTFTGSGTTGCAAVLEGFDFIGVEREPEYAAIARARIEWWARYDPGVDTDVALVAGRKRDVVEAGGLGSLFDDLNEEAAA